MVGLPRDKIDSFDNSARETALGAGRRGKGSTVCKIRCGETKKEASTSAEGSKRAG